MLRKKQKKEKRLKGSYQNTPLDLQEKRLYLFPGLMPALSKSEAETQN